jgi:hypothetical protein
VLVSNPPSVAKIDAGRILIDGVNTHDRDLAAIADRVATLTGPGPRGRPGDHRNKNFNQRKGGEHHEWNHQACHEQAGRRLGPPRLGAPRSLVPVPQVLPRQVLPRQVLGLG